ncbi:hypothetical protein AU381_22975 [Sinorhizobium glycinis]|uniref:Tyr recombinase domain-containing protein n=1 Tax=Sinorhizobium glycinis TaxID=1472378 RepID=A0A178XUG3_9HYPH|nr:site-specific integrase [Sinorhizobium glycinis]OAP38433.1 hypothetical protein AU381_22975 [Sinorhizobium glycinis]
MDTEWSPFDIAVAKGPSTSNQSKSDLFYAALTAILEVCDPAEVPAYNGRFSREWFSDQIGCSTSTLTTSTRLRKALSLWEAKHRLKMVSTTPRLEDDDTNVADLSTHRSAGIILKIPVTIARAKRPQTKDVPTLVWLDGMDDWVADYARYLVFKGRKAVSSVEETVKKLRPFRRFQRKFKVPYDQVNDDFLVAWQAEMASHARSTVKRQNECLSAVHDFLKWAQSVGFLKNHVQVAAKQDYPGLSQDYVFPISSEEVLVAGKYGKTYSKWVSTLTGGGQESTYGRRNTPTSEQVLRLGEVVEAHKRNSVRNKLMMDWALFTGARVSELLQIKESHLPPFHDIQSFFDDTGQLKVFEIWVERKNRGMARLRVPGDLALRTAEYIAEDSERLQIIANELSGERRNDRFVFLSERGDVLHPDSVTRIFGKFFRLAGIKKGNIHRLRAKYITEVIEFQLDRLAERGIECDPTSSWANTVLITAAQLMGHSHPISLMPYLNEILQKRMTTDGKIEPRSVEVRERSLNNLIQQLDRRLTHHRGLAEAARLMQEKRYVEAREIVGDIFDQLSDLANV